jgi:hypothetical protein
MDTLTPLNNLALFGVSVELLVNIIPPLLLSNMTPALDGSIGETLRIDWNVRKVQGPALDECRIQIYNVDRITQVAISKLRHASDGWPRAALSTLSLAIGWQAVPRPLFTAPVTDFTVRRQVGTDVITELVAGPGGWTEVADTAAGLNEAGGQPFAIGAQFTVALLARRLGIVASAAVIAIVGARAAQVPIGLWCRTDLDPASTALDKLMATLGLNWGIDGVQLVIYADGARLDIPGVQLSTSSGLLAWSAKRDGFEFEALASAAVTPGCQMLFFDDNGVTSELLSPPVFCEEVEFTGSTMGGSTMRGVARQRKIIGGEPPNPLILNPFMA